MTNYSDEPSAVDTTSDLTENRGTRETRETDVAVAPTAPTATSEDVRAAMPIAKRTRVSTAWVGAVLAALLLVVLLVFILQNSSKVPVKFLWLTGHLPLGVALLFAAVGGVLFMGAVTGARVVQLRLAAHRVEKAAR